MADKDLEIQIRALVGERDDILEFFTEENSHRSELVMLNFVKRRLGVLFQDSQEIASVVSKELRLRVLKKGGLKLKSLQQVEKLLPLDYEKYCAQCLEHDGWRTELTKASGDQGVDIVARKRRKVMVVQVKKYSSPVGNAAVQEVFSGKTFYGADYALVVSNASFTPSARALAKRTGVFLVHHENLIGLQLP